MRMVYPERPAHAPKMMYIFDGKKSTSIHLPSMNLSDVVPLPKGECTLIITEKEIKDQDQIPVDAIRVIIPEKASDCYLIMISDPTNDQSPIKVKLIDCSEPQLHGGQTLWFNFTNHRIIADLGSSALSVDANSHAMSDAPMDQSGYYVAKFSYQLNGTAPVAPITEQSWWHDAKSRHLGFIYDNGEKLPKIYYFRDFRIEGEDQNRKS